jgi:hypothetical protein
MKISSYTLRLGDYFIPNTATAVLSFLIKHTETTNINMCFRTLNDPVHDYRPMGIMTGVTLQLTLYLCIEVIFITSYFIRPFQTDTVLKM